MRLSLRRFHLPSGAAGAAVEPRSTGAEVGRAPDHRKATEAPTVERPTRSSADRGRRGADGADEHNGRSCRMVNERRCFFSGLVEG